MCCFTATVDHVFGTSIFVGPVVGRRQFVVYENRVHVRELFDENGPYAAMILPFPTRGGRVQLLDLSQEPYKSIFFDLRQAFPVHEIEKSATSSTSSGGFLSVQTIGGYKMSVAHSLADLDRADGSVFRMPPNLAETLRIHYGNGFGFIIAAFWDSGEKHPLGYIHDRVGNELFVPTRHYHGGEGDDSNEEGHFYEFNKRWIEKETHEFDHHIFSLNTTSDAGCSVADWEKTFRAEFRAANRNYIASLHEQDIPRKERWKRSLYVRLRRINLWNISLGKALSSLPVHTGIVAHSLRYLSVRGKHPNGDMVLPLGRTSARCMEDWDWSQKPDHSSFYAPPFVRRIKKDWGPPPRSSRVYKSSSSSFNDDPVIEL